MVKIDISRLVPEGSIVEHEGQSFSIPPLSVEEQAIFARHLKKEENEKAAEYLFVASLMAADSTLKEEDIKNIRNREFTEKVMKAAMKANGFNIPKNFQESNQETSQEKSTNESTAEKAA